MRKPWLLLALGIIALALVVGVILWRHGTGGAPQVSAALSARNTVGVVSVEGLDGLVRNLDALANKLPESARKAAGPLLDPTQRKTVLGFDPATAAGWTSIGLDPQAGVAVAADARLTQTSTHQPAPMLLLRVTDRAALGKWLTARVGKPVDLGPAAETVRTLTVNGIRVQAGPLHGWTAIVADPGEASDTALVASLGKLIAVDEPVLSGDASFRAAVAEAPSGPRAIAWGGADGASALLKTQGMSANTLAMIDHFGHLFRGVSVYGGTEGGGARLVASADGVHALRQVLVPARSAPAFAAMLPGKGWAALRISLNLKEIFDGVGALVPPSMTEVKSGIGAARMFMPMAVGFGWDDVTKALSGHVVVGVALGSLPLGDKPLTAPDWRALIAVEDAKAADALLVQVVAALRKKGIEVKDVQVGEDKGVQIDMAGQQAVVVRHGEVVVMGPGVAAVQATLALGKSDSMAGSSAADVLDGEVSFGFVLDGAGLPVQAGAAPTVPASGPLSTRLVVDDRGLLLTTSGSAEAASQISGVLAALATHRFQDYANKSRATEAVVNLRAIQTATQLYYADHQALPPAAGPNPAQGECKSGQSLAITAQEWQVPGWTAVHFAPEGQLFYRYRTTATADTFTIEATGDLDCDGTFSTFRMTGKVANGNLEFGELDRENESE
jgi:type II secretory pathway pseudopilin PulG